MNNTPPLQLPILDGFRYLKCTLIQSPNLIKIGDVFDYVVYQSELTKSYFIIYNHKTNNYHMFENFDNDANYLKRLKLSILTYFPL